MMKKTLNLFFSILIIFSSTLVFAKGKFEETTGKVKANLVVSFQYEEATPQDWKPLFDNANTLLWNATEGQIQLGRIDVYINQMADDADILIANGNSAASAHVGAYCTTDGHIFLSQTHKIQDQATQRGYFGLIHEFGHYAFELYDEYIGYVYEGGPGGLPLLENGEADYIYNIDFDGTTASIMDGGTTIAPNNLRTEFSVAANHRFPFTNSDGDYVVLSQNHENPGEADWDTIVRVLTGAKYNMPVSPPAGVPSTDLPVGLDPIEWVVHGGVRQVLCIDRSGSMSGNPMYLAKGGASLYADLLIASDSIAVTSYATSASVNYGMTTVTAENRDSVIANCQAAINTLNASGGTGMGLGLSASIGQITAQTGVAAKKAIILLSDGWHNYSTHPSAFYQTLKDENITVYTVAIGTGADQNLMATIADETGGVYSWAQTESELPVIFYLIQTALHDSGTVGGGSGEASEMASESVRIDIFVQTAKFILTWDGGYVPTLVLVDPDGNRIPEGTQTAEIIYVAGQGYKFFEVAGPIQGEWRMEITNNTAAPAIGYTAQVISQGEGVQFAVRPNKSSFLYPEPVHVQAEVIANKPVDGAEVGGIVMRPDGTQADIVLFDDGAAEHGDKTAYDGIYANYFSDFSGSGSYVFKMAVVNEDGLEMYRAPGSEQHTAPPAPVAPFTRLADFSVVVNEVPQYLNGTVSGTGYVLLDNDSRFRGYFNAACQSSGGVKTGTIMFRHYGPTFGKVYMDSETIDAMSFSPDRKSALVVGKCKVNNVSGYEYSIRLTDNGSPGARIDTLTITITGPDNYQFTMGEFLTGGEIAVDIP